MSVRTILTIAILGLAAAPAAAQTDGTIELRLGRAYDPTGHIDPLDPFAFLQDQADFYGKGQINLGPLTSSEPAISNKDEVDLGFVVSGTAPLTQRYHSIRIQLWDSDQPFGESLVDINPASGKKDLDLLFDACTFTWNGDAVGGRGGQGIRGAGDGDDPGELWFDIDTADGRPFSPDDIAIHGAFPVQVTFDDEYVVSGKETVFRLELTSSYTVPRDGTVTVTVTDGVGNVFEETRSVTVPPEGSTLYLFDGSQGVPPFVPFGTLNLSELCWTVTADFGAEGPSSGPPPGFENCYFGNNQVPNTCRRMAFIAAPRVMYLPFDWDVGAATLPPTTVAAAQTFLASEPFRVATSPIPFSDAVLSPAPFLGPAPWDHAEPVVTMLRMRSAAMAAGVDRLILMPRNGWFAANDAALDFGNGAIGLSLGEIVPSVVISEAGFSETSTHEIGHTYRLSRHSCTTGGVFEDLFDLGCRDEYTHFPGNPAPYPASGFDVAGGVYPSGASPVTPGTREVFNPNIMGSTGAGIGTYNRWIDALNYNYLLREMSGVTPLPPVSATQATTAISVAGLLEATNGIGANPPVFVGSLLPSFQVDAATSGFDMEEPSPGKISGSGTFAVRFVTPAGPRTYRFEPPFSFPETSGPSDLGGFAFALPWDPATTRIELYGPSDLYQPGQNQDTLLFAVDKTAALPAIQNVRAGVDVPPTQGGPEPPTIPPGHTVAFAWEETDGDSSTLSTELFVHPPPVVYDGLVPLTVDLAQTEFVMPQIVRDALPAGDYGMEWYVSDGVNSTRHVEPLAFRICAFENGGVEVCDAADDDCNGIVDDVSGLDADLDAVDDACDNCPGVANASQANADADPLGDACDCAPGDPGTWAVPGFVTGLRADPSPNGDDYTLLSWDSLAAQAGTSVVYDVQSGDVATLRTPGAFLDSSCVFVDAQGTSTTVYRPAPAPGQAIWFLLRGETPCGKGTYDSGTPSQAGGRDPLILQSAGPCV